MKQFQRLIPDKSTVIGMLVFVSLLVHSASAQNPLCTQLNYHYEFTGNPCCWSFTFVNDQAGVPQVPICKMAIDVEGPKGCVVSSAKGPAGTVVSSTSTNVTWNIPNNLAQGPNPGFGICFTNNGAGPGPRIVIKWFSCTNGNIELVCSDTLRLDCPGKPVESDSCITMQKDSIICATEKDPAGNVVKSFFHRFDIRHLLSCPNTNATITVISPAGVNIDPPSIPVGNVFTPQSVRISGPGATSGTVVRYQIRVCCQTQSEPEQCCADTVSIVLPECKVDTGCFEIAEQKISCTTGPGGASFQWCFRLKNTSPFNLYAVNVQSSSPSNISITPTTFSFGPQLISGTASGWNCVSVSGPGALAGSTVVLTLRACGFGENAPGLQCCEGKIGIQLPDCPNVVDCCHEFIKEFTGLVNSASANGQTVLRGFLRAAPSTLASISVTMVSSTINNNWCPGGFVPINTIGGFGSGLIPYEREAVFGPASGVDLTGWTPMFFTMKFPPVTSQSDVLQYCLRFRYTDMNCRTCDTVICITRQRFKIFTPSDVNDGTKRGDEGLPDGATLLNGSGIGDVVVREERKNMK